MTNDDGEIREVRRPFLASNAQAVYVVFFSGTGRKRQFFCRLCLVVYLVYLVGGAKTLKNAVVVRVQAFFLNPNVPYSVTKCPLLCYQMSPTLCTD